MEGRRSSFLRGQDHPRQHTCSGRRRCAGSQHACRSGLGSPGAAAQERIRDGKRSRTPWDV
eukprot:364776-Chlamydomonas_euryale.AAC.9